ncbi:MAG: YbaN family protein [Pelagimonas sp.]|jgi:uncharacterized membrane protein YbaN (DUF454 family)|nr:YbaN family protein [Pelagimonas sp.]
MSHQQRPPLLSNPLWAAFGLICVALGMIGVLLPVLPTTPFMILAAFAFGKGSPRLRYWLETHPTFGPPIVEWEESGSIAPRYKSIAVGMMSGTFLLSLIFGLSTRILIIQAICMGGAALYVLTRPNGPKES